MYDLDKQKQYTDGKKQYLEEGKQSFINKSVINAKELVKLRKELDDLRMENEILKKAKVYFAQRKRKDRLCSKQTKRISRKQSMQNIRNKENKLLLQEKAPSK